MPELLFRLLVDSQRSEEEIAKGQEYAAKGQLAVREQFVRHLPQAGDARQIDQTESKEGDSALDKNSRRRCDMNRLNKARITQLCPMVVRGQECSRKNCEFIHDPSEWAAERSEIPLMCPTFQSRGCCPFGVNCLCSGHVGFDTAEPPRLASSAPDCKPQADIRMISTQALKAVRQDYGGKTIKRLTTFPREPLRAGFLRGKTVLAPMCTVGTLPFRRLCVRLGCDATMSEMVLAPQLLRGDAEEWSRLRRHPEERLFGAQITGRGDSLAAAAQAVVDVLGPEGVDWVDLNAACPQNFVTSRGLGSALNCSAAGLVDGPLDTLVGALSGSGVRATVKVRMGPRPGELHGVELAELLRTRVADDTRWSVFEGLTMHGRTAAQRYSKASDVGYLGQVAAALHDGDSGLTMVGNGDVYDLRSYRALVDAGCDSVMIGRGALIKPWLFKEITTQHELDPTPSERLELLREFASLLLEVHGSDRRGVERSRTVLLEHLSFLYRYTPTALLSDPSTQRINLQPEPFVGRDEMETLMGSGSAADWVRLSELVLGPAPAGFTFTPKHKSNAYESILPAQ